MKFTEAKFTNPDETEIAATYEDGSTVAFPFDSNHKMYRKMTDDGVVPNSYQDPASQVHDADEEATIRINTVLRGPTIQIKMNAVATKLLRKEAKGLANPIESATLDLLEEAIDWVEATTLKGHELKANGTTHFQEDLLWPTLSVEAKAVIGAL